MAAHITAIKDRQTPVRAALRKALTKQASSLVFVLATENVEWSESDRQTAEQARIVVWDEYDVLALQELTQIAGEGARYQVYNRVFYNAKVKSFEVTLPAIRARMGGLTYYCMGMTPEHLLKVAYVHQRSPTSSFIDISNTYQRLLDPSRIQSIKRYLEGGGFFPNSIIINLTRPLKAIQTLGTAKHKITTGTSEPVVVTFPPYYGSAWIIDGQHRLYGYADSPFKATETLPVVALVGLDVEDQARVFLDINQNQKTIASDLRWDLYEDLFRNAKADREQKLYATGLIAKRLNQLNPLRDTVKIPSTHTTGHISLTTLCRVIHNLNFIDQKSGPLFSKTTSQSIEFAAQRIAACLEAVADQLPTQWRQRDAHYINTNAGLVVLLGLIRDILGSLDPAGVNEVGRLRESLQAMLAPVISHLRDASPDTIEGYRRIGGATGPSREVQARLTQLVTDANPSFHSSFLAQYLAERARERERALAMEGPHTVLLAGEGDTIEVKASLSLDIDRLLRGDGQSLKSDQVLKEAMSTVVAFLNSTRGGGKLIVGALESNRYEPAGIEGRFGVCPIVGSYTILGIEQEPGFTDWESYEIRIRQIISSRIAADIAPSIQIERVPVDDRTLAILTVTRDPQRWRYLENSGFFVRSGSHTRLLTGSDMDNYKQAWTGKVH